MQLLVDTTQETPASLRFIAATLCALADTYGPPLEPSAEHPDITQPSINGPSQPVVLHAHEVAAPEFARKDVYAGVIHQNIDPRPQAPLDPAVVFGVPAGTTQDPTLPVSVTGLALIPAPPVPTNPTPAAPPAPVMAATPVGAAVVGPIGTTPKAPATPAVSTASAIRDKDGFPWDERVHSETRKMNADGTWRYRRNLDPVVKATVTAELKAQYGIQSQTPLRSAPIPPVYEPQTYTLTAPQAPPPPTATVLPQPGPGLQQPAAPVPMPPGVPMGVPNAPLPPVVLGFRDFMSKVNKAQAAGTLTQAQLDQACLAINLSGMTELASQPMKIPLIHAQIAHLLGAVPA